MDCSGLRFEAEAAAALLRNFFIPFNVALSHSYDFCVVATWQRARTCHLLSQLVLVLMHGHYTFRSNRL